MLDDVWVTDQRTWGTIQCSMPRIGGSTDNMIFVTTKDDKVVSMIDTSLVRHSGRLLACDSWFLFRKIAFASRLYEDIMKLDATGKVIAGKSNRVSLVITAIAGLAKTISSNGDRISNDLVLQIYLH